MQPQQPPEKKFEWDEASESYEIPTQVLRGELPVQPNAQPFQPYQQNIQQHPQMMGNNMMGNNMMGNGMMGNGMMAPMAETNANTAFVLSIVALVGFFIFPLAIFVAPFSLVMANKALKVTNLNPTFHPDHGKARAAQIISAIVTGILCLFLAFFALIVVGLAVGGF